MNTPTGTGGDGAVNAGLALAGAALATAAFLGLAGGLSALATGGTWPDDWLTSGLRVLTTPGDPAAAFPGAGVPGAPWYWTTVAALAATAGAAGFGVYRAWAAHQARPATRRRRLHGTPGTARRAEIARDAGPAALRRLAPVLRPSLGRRPPLDQLGYRLGQSQGVDVWASVEDSIVIVGPPRSGKGRTLVIPSMLSAPGPVISTETRVGTLAVTLRARQRRGGPVALFDPQGLTGHDLGWRWPLVAGCEEPRVAMVRARGLVSASGAGSASVTDADLWRGLSESVVQCLLHAAALSRADVLQLWQWSVSPGAAEAAAHVLRTHPDAAAGWDDLALSAIRADPRTRDSIWLGVRNALHGLTLPSVRHALDPTTGRTLNPTTFLREEGTLYVLGSEAGVGAAGGLIAALIEDLVETARTLAAHSPGGRLDPPLLVSLDEVANLVPLPSLPTLLSDGGGSGITPLVVLQSRAQAGARWSPQQAGAMFGSATITVVLGGGDGEDTRYLAAMLGQRDETITTKSWGTGNTHTSTQLRQVPILSERQLRELPRGMGLVLLRSTPPILADLQDWEDGPRSRELRRDVASY